MSHGLAPRPEPSPEELGAVVAALNELMGPTSVLDDDVVPVWRFSGRWFNGGPFALRRP